MTYTTSLHEGFCPYETRLEIRSRRSLIALPDEHIEALIGATGAKIVDRRREHRFASYILSMSSLFLFEHSLVLICCSQTGLSHTVRQISSFMAEADIISASLEQRRPLNTPYSSSCDIASPFLRFTAGTLHFEEAVGRSNTTFVSQPAPSSEVSPCQLSPWHSVSTFFNLRNPVCSDATIRLLHELYPDSLVHHHNFNPSGWSLNVVLSPKNPSGYVTIHCSDRLYLSLEFYAFPEASTTLEKNFLHAHAEISCIAAAEGSLSWGLVKNP